MASEWMMVQAVIEHLKPTKSDAAHGHTPAGLAAS